MAPVRHRDSHCPWRGRGYWTSATSIPTSGASTPESQGWPLRHVYAREAVRWPMPRRHYVREFDARLVVSEAEAQHPARAGGDDVEGSIRRRAKRRGHRLFRSDSRLFEGPFSADARPIVFTGAMDYHANVDGGQMVRARNACRPIRRHGPEPLFAIVGSNPTAEVRRLPSCPASW